MFRKCYICKLKQKKNDMSAFSTQSIRRGLSVVALFSAFMVFPSGLHAQRTSARSFFMDASAGVTVASIPSGTGGVGFGQYLVRGYWKAYAKVADYKHLVSEASGKVYDHAAWHAGAAGMYRLFSSYSRAFSMYVGGGVFLGCNQYYAFLPYPEGYSTSLPAAEFICGATPEIELELYLTRRLAVIALAQLPFTICSSYPGDWYNFSCSAGLRYNF